MLGKLQQARLLWPTLLAIAGLAILPLFSRAPLPQFKELSMLIQLKAIPGTSQPEMSRITGRMGNELRNRHGRE